MAALSQEHSSSHVATPSEHSSPTRQNQVMKTVEMEKIHVSYKHVV